MHFRKTFWALSVVWAFCILLAMAANGLAAQATLTWQDPNNSASQVGGYNLYYWPSGATTQSKVNVGKVFSFTLTGLADGTIYNFAVTTYDLSGGRESAFSTSVSTTFPPASAAPVANFSATPTSGPAPLAVTFNNTSTGSTSSWAWTFGDGTTSTAQNPSKTYATAGTYTVSLKATGPGGSNTMTKTGYITVSGSSTAAPVANFTATPTSGSAPSAVTFNNTSTGSTSSWAWTFGDGTTSTAQNPSKTYATAGTYTVSLKATGPGGSNTMTKTGYITVSGSSGGSLVMNTIEAESMTLSGYVIENNADASGGRLISRLNASATPPGRATATFTGPAGFYDIVVTYFDENDGQCTFEFLLDSNVLDTWTANASLPGSLASAATLAFRTVAQRVWLDGDTVQIRGTEQANEFARVDKIEFIPVQ